MPAVPKQNRFLRGILVVLALFKIRITAVVLISTATGYLWADPSFSDQMLFTLAGTFLLSCGAAALNHIQDASIDMRMERTANRPIPSGQISRHNAFFAAGLMILLGLSFLASIEDQTLLLLGLGVASLVWYNVVYYYLKRWTAFAVVPGSLIGALPPLIGWVAGGGHPFHPFSILMASFFVVWQIPHFWLLQLNRADEYKKAGLPALSDHFTPDQLGRITTAWLLGTAVAGTAFPALAGDLLPFGWRAAMLLASVWLGFAAFKILGRPHGKSSYNRAFIEINGYALVMMFCLSIGVI